MLRWLAIGVGAAAVAALVLLLWVRSLLQPVASEAEPVLFTVERGATMGRVARDLEARGLVKSERALRWFARVRGVDGDLKVGEYELSADRSTPALLEIITKGRVVSYEVVVPEGIRMTEIAARLAEKELAEKQAFLDVASDPELAAALGVEGDTLEGYLYPETYRLPRNLEPEEIARAMVHQFFQAWEPVAPLAAEQGMSMREVVTLASIVEKETAAPEERPLIAAVFLNRLDKGMRLETDPTVIYGIADFDGNLRRVHLEDASNVYNTYRIRGLPRARSPARAAMRCARWWSRPRATICSSCRATTARTTSRAPIAST